MSQEEKKKELVDKLLAIGGKSVELPESISDDLISFGHLLDYNVMFVPGGTSRLYMSQQDNDKIRVVSGFVLMDDDIWRSHAWLVLDNVNYKIVDNIKAKKYFGVIMS